MCRTSSSIRHGQDAYAASPSLCGTSSRTPISATVGNELRAGIALMSPTNALSPRG